MKKILSIVLIPVLAVSLFSLCAGAQTDVAEEPPLNWFRYLATDLPLSSFEATDDMTSSSFVKWWWNYWNRYSGQLERHDWIVGDVNADGAVTVSDALFALKYAVDEDGLSNPTPQAIELRMGRFIRLGAYTRPYRKMALIGRRDAPYWTYMWSVTCLCNSRLMSDVTGDCLITSADALAILQYTVGKRTAFARTDYSGNKDLFFVPYVADWKPGDIAWLGRYEDILESEYYPVDESLIPDWDAYAGDDKDFFIY